MEFNPVIQDNENLDREFPPTMDPVIFNSEGEKIVGTMFIANGKGPHPIVLLLHGFPGNETNFDLAHALKRAGINVFVFHYRGTWGSSGEFSFVNGIKDTENALHFLQNKDVCNKYRVDSTRINIVGYSMGGFFGMFSCLGKSFIKNAAFIAGFNFGLFFKLMPTIDNAEKLTIENLQKGSEILTKANPETLFNQIRDNAENWNLVNSINKLKDINLLFIAGLYDKTAPVEIHHKPLVTAAELMEINPEHHILETGHGFSNKRIELASILTKWLCKANNL